MRVVLATLVCMALLASVLPVSSAFDPPEPAERDHYEAWSTGTTFTGDLTVRFTVDLGSSNDCVIYVGLTSLTPSGDLYMKVDSTMFGMTAWGGRLVQVHHGDVDTRQVTGSGGGLGLRMTLAGPMSGVHDLSMTVFGGGTLSIGDDPWVPLEYGIGCDDPFTIDDLAGGTEAIGFTHQSLDGTGASLNGLFLGASANLGSTITGTFTAPDVRFAWENYGAAIGEVTLQSDDDSVAWTLGETGGGVYEGGPGTYTIGLDRVSAAMFEGFIGIVTATQPIADLDDLL
jgi:hypothetical protein